MSLSSNWTLKQVPSQKGRIAIVTGANSGLGFETTLALAGKGMKVILACRNMEKANKAKAKIKQQHPYAHLECRQIDLSKLKSVRSFVANFLKDYQQLDLLINNAGIMIPPFSLTEDGFESQMAANYFGHFVLTQGLLTTLMKTPKSRVISLSSIAHRQGRIDFEDLQHKEEYDSTIAYCQSKLACLIFAIELQRKLEKAGSDTISLAAHPGISDTELMRYLQDWQKIIFPIAIPLITHKPNKAALPTLRAALDEAAKGGDFYGPNGIREYKGKPVKVKPKSKALNEALAKQLWSVSEVLTNSVYPI